ncbi:MAG: FecR domain-containing protein [Bacteroidota bacterium]
MDPKEKKELNQRIMDSVHRHRRKRRIVKLSVAASVLALLALGSSVWYFQNGFGASQLSIKDYATSGNSNINSGTEVKLVLANEREVRIESDNSQITYSDEGKTVKIDNQENLNQAPEEDSEVVYNTMVVPYGKKSRISLADGSVVWLNSGTRLTYPIAFTGKRREVYLEGEAIFEVAHNKAHPFYVYTEDYEVKVLGTVFNVSSYPDDAHTSTALESGKVEISFPEKMGTGGGPTTISPGTMATFHKTRRNMEIKKVDVKHYMSWREGVFIFENDALRSILKKVSRHYRVNISIADENLAEQTFSGTLDISKSLEDVLGIIKETSDFDYQNLDDQIKINQNN